MIGGRPGVPTFIWRNFVDSLSRKRFQKIFVGKDGEGNRYYELIKSKRSVKRGFIPVKNSSEKPPPEWLTWLRGLRKLPPTEEEIAAIRRASEEMALKVEKLAAEESIRQQQRQHVNESGRMPHVESKTTIDVESEPRGFPRYPDYDKEQPKMT